MRTQLKRGVAQRCASFIEGCGQAMGGARGRAAANGREAPGVALRAGPPEDSENCAAARGE